MTSLELASKITVTPMASIFHPDERTRYATWTPLAEFIEKEDLVQVIVSKPLGNPVITIIFKDGSRVNFAATLDKQEGSA